MEPANILSIRLPNLNPVPCPKCDSLQPNVQECIVHLFDKCLGFAQKCQKKKIYNWLREFLEPDISPKTYGLQQTVIINNILATSEETNVKIIELCYAEPARCPVCRVNFFIDQIFDHVFEKFISTNPTLKNHLMNWLLDFFQTDINRNFNPYRTCLLCNYRTMDKSEFTDHIISSHIPKCLSCGCGFNSYKRLQDHLLKLNSRTTRRGRNHGVECPLCRKKKFDQDNVLYLQEHLLECKPSREIMTADESIVENVLPEEQIHEICLLCKPARLILFTDLDDHIGNHEELQASEFELENNVENAPTADHIGQLCLPCEPAHLIFEDHIRNHEKLQATAAENTIENATTAEHIGQPCLPCEAAHLIFDDNLRNCEELQAKEFEPNGETRTAADNTVENAPTAEHIGELCFPCEPAHLIFDENIRNHEELQATEFESRGKIRTADENTVINAPTEEHIDQLCLLCEPARLILSINFGDHIRKHEELQASVGQICILCNPPCLISTDFRDHIKTHDENDFSFLLDEK